MSQDTTDDKEIPLQKPGGFPQMLRMSVVNWVINAITAFLNMVIDVPMTDGTGVLNKRQAVVKISGGKCVITMPTMVDWQSLASSGWNFKSPAELDPSVAVAANSVVYLSPQNPLVTTGLKDLVSGAVVKSLAGLWVAKQAVPAQVTVSGVICYNVPQLPYPGATGTPSGTPLQGDLDGANVFWVFISQAPVCTS